MSVPVPDEKEMTNMHTEQIEAYEAMVAISGECFRISGPTNFNAAVSIIVETNIPTSPPMCKMRRPNFG